MIEYGQGLGLLQLPPTRWKDLQISGTSPVNRITVVGTIAPSHGTPSASTVKVIKHGLVGDRNLALPIFHT